MAPKFGWVTVGKLGSTSLHWQLGKSGEHKDLKFELIKFISDPNFFKIRPIISNYKENQPIIQCKYMITTFTSDSVYETMKLTSLPIEEFGSPRVFWVSNGWDRGVITCISSCKSYSKSEKE